MAEHDAAYRETEAAYRAASALAVELREAADETSATARAKLKTLEASVARVRRAAAVYGAVGDRVKTGAPPSATENERLKRQRQEVQGMTAGWADQSSEAAERVSVLWPEPKR